MNTVAVRRYTDADLQHRPYLVGLAERYLAEYTGAFEFLIAAQALLESRGSLPPGVARGVLNCMRVDPNAYQLVPELADNPPIERPSAWRPRRLRAVREDEAPERKWVLSGMAFRIKPKFKYGYARNGSVLHVLRGAEIRWYPESLPVGFARDPEPKVGWICSSSYSNWCSVPGLLVEVPDDEDVLCRTCLRRLGEIE